MSVGEYAFVPQKDLVESIRRQLSRMKSKHGKGENYYYYRLGPPYGDRIVDLDAARQLEMVSRVNELRKSVSEERRFFRDRLVRGVRTPSGRKPLGRSHIEYLHNILSMNPKSRVIAKVDCPLRQHRSKDDRVTYNLETQNLATLVDERWLDNFAMDCLLADLNRKFLRQGHVFLPTMFQTLAEIHADNDLSDMIRDAVEAVARAQGRSRASCVVTNVYVPILHSQSHWALGIVSFARRRTEYFDSLQYAPAVSATNCIRRVLREFASHLPRNYPSCAGPIMNRSREWNSGQKQGYVRGRQVVSSGSCGSIAVHACYTLAKGNSLRWGYEDVPYVRLDQMLLLCGRDYVTKSTISRS